MPSSLAFRAFVPLILCASVANAAPTFLHVDGNGAPGVTTFEIHGNPNATFLVVVATSLNPQTVSGVEVHVDLSLLHLSGPLGLTGVLDATGSAVVTTTIPASVVGSTFYFQAFEVTPTLAASNWASVTYQPAPGTGTGSGVADWEHRLGGTAHGVFFLDENTGWVAEDGGRVRMTHDGGATWRVQQTPDAARYELKDIFFLDSQRGWAVGDKGTVLRTTNSGATWDAVFVHDEELYGVHFVSPTTGWVVGKANTGMVSTDGGKTWTQQLPSFSHQDWYAVQFTSPDEGWIVGDNNRILWTGNAGLTWIEQLSPPPPSPGDDVELWGLAMASPLVGYAAGGVANQNGVLYSTSNGGLTWTHDAMAGPTGPLNSVPTLYNVTTLPGGGALAVGYAATIMKSAGPHAVWQRQAHSLSKPVLRNVHAPTSNVVVAVGIHGAIRRSTTGGATFTNLANPNTWRLSGGDFVDASTGWVIGQGSRIARTDDGGLTFTEQQPLTVGVGNAIAFLDKLHGVAGGSHGFLRTTHDGGATWLRTNLAANVEIHDVAVLSPTQMWAVGAGGLVLHSTNGGTSWTESILGSATLFGIGFFDVDNGFVVGDLGVAFAFNGGTWTQLSTPVGQALTDVVSDALGHGWVCGTGAGQVYEVIGSQLVVAHASLNGQDLASIDVLPSGEVWAAGVGGYAVRFAAGVWSEPKLGTSGDIHAIDFVGPDEGFFVGRENLVFAYTGQ